jgi:hypothetical protein
MSSEERTEKESIQDESISVVCFLWDDGVRNYLPEHVNQLAIMVHKHLAVPHRFICITDEEDGFSDDVELFKLPEDARWTLGLLNPTGSKKGHLPSSYRRLWLFSEEAKALGDRILMTDIDCLVVNSLEPVFDFTEDFVGWRPRSEETTKVKAKVPYKRIGGGTWLLRTGSMTHIWDDFSTEGIEAAMLEGWRGSDQAWLSYNLAKDCMVFPDDVGIYHTQDGAKYWEETPKDARIIHFNGKVNPWDEDARSRPWFCRLIGVPYDKTKWKKKKPVPFRKRKRQHGPEPVEVERVAEEIDIVIYWWDKWPEGLPGMGTAYIKKLVAGVKLHIPDDIDYRIILFTDNMDVQISGVETRALDIPNFRWNLKKMFMYSKKANLRKHVLCLDLDCIIVGDLSPVIRQVLALNRKLLVTCIGAYRKKRLGGSVIGFRTCRELNKLLWEPLLGERRASLEGITKGSERRYLQRQLAPKQVGMWERYLPGQVLSYKRDCKNGLPHGASIVRFHGSPRPHQVNDDWVKENWK